MFAKLSRKEEGFTLIELLVVVAIIALLAAFAVPRLFDAINSARKAPGQADLPTISSAFERYFFDEKNQKYPTATAGTDLEAVGTEVGKLVVGTYLKNGTTFKNGYGKYYFYQTDTNGSYYVLVDPGNSEKEVIVTCGGWSSAYWTPSKAKFQAKTDGGTAPTSAQIAAGCKVFETNATTHAATTTEVANAQVLTY